MSTGATGSEQEPFRQAADGNFYTKQEFLSWFGKQGEATWSKAEAKTAGASEATGSASEHAGSASKPAGSASEPSGASPQNIVFTKEDLRNWRGEQAGGKQACQKQRELRQRLLATTDVREEDLTLSDFNWKGVLKSLPLGAEVVGPGVCKFTFRLLTQVRDHNYIKFDSGERHVFEVTRRDGSKAHLHFHKSGKCDRPEIFNRAAVDLGADEPEGDRDIDEPSRNCSSLGHAPN